MTSVEPEREDRTSQKAVGSPAVSDSGVSNGSSTFLYENGGSTVSEAASRPPPPTTIVTPSDTTGVGVTTVKRTSFLSLDGHTDKGLSCLSLEVCASGDNINMLTQDDLSGCGSSSGPGSMGSLERELEAVEFSASITTDKKEDSLMEDGKESLTSEQEEVQNGDGSGRSSGAHPEGKRNFTMDALLNESVRLKVSVGVALVCVVLTL